ncbi:MAG: beta-L-arabinofuranosidase domain-containing protein [Verrucomicrobiota bacterium]
MKTQHKHLIGLAVMGVMMIRGNAAENQRNPPPVRGFQEVGQVELSGGFWGPRIKTTHDVTIPHALDELEKDGHVTNFDKAAGKFDGPLKGHHAFDSDLYKTLEGAMDSLEQFDDPALKKRLDGIIDRILAAQQKDGFLITWFIVNGLDKRWEDLRLEHQMYNAGHFFEMAVEHQHLTGESKVIDSAKRFADHIDGIFGPNKRYDVDGHQEVELALIKLYRGTGERRYLDLAKFFLDERGYAHGTERKPFDPKTQVLPTAPAVKLTPEQKREFWHARLRLRNGRMQDHKPVVDQHEAVGHAVRAGYMYSAMADMLRFTEAPGYENALDHLWDDVVGRKMYITGSLGTGQYDDEGFGDAYLLPNESAYNESCAAIAHVFWQHRMNLLKGQSKYADMMELALYNGVLSGVSISGDHFFYQNPLASEHGGPRDSWIGLSCCPTNLARIFPQIGGLVYAQSKKQVLVNLYAAGTAKLQMDDGSTLKLTQQTEYPWDGKVRLTVDPAQAADFALKLRIPGWAIGRPVPSDLYRPTDAKASPIVLTVNGEKTDAAPGDDGYVRLQRTWKGGDVVEIDLPMPIRRILANEKVEADRGKVTLMRGPMVYCLEAADQPDVNLPRLILPRAAEMTAKHRSDLLGGVTVLEGEALADGSNPVKVTAIPYYAWQNRSKGAMTVWIQEK